MANAAHFGPTRIDDTMRDTAEDLVSPALLQRERHGRLESKSALILARIARSCQGSSVHRRPLLNFRG